MPPLNLSVIITGIVFILMAARQIIRIELKLWQIALGGAVVVLLTGQVSIPVAISYLDPAVILFLTGIFAIGAALDESGYIHRLLNLLFRHARSVDGLIVLILISTAAAAALLLNDTAAIIGTPVVLLMASRERIDPKLMLLALAFGATTGSVTSPIGNPQNLLIASSGMVSNPFLTYFSYLALPTCINLAVVFLVLRVFYRKEFGRQRLAHVDIGLRDESLARLCRLSLLLLVSLVIMHTVVKSLDASLSFSFAYISLIAALPLFIFSPKRGQIARNIDWPTIIFFLSLFVLVGSLWQSGFIQQIVSPQETRIGSMPNVLAGSILGSQFISNVPVVMIYLKLLVFRNTSAAVLMALAAGSSIAGNLTILGAASNIIVVQGAERYEPKTMLTFTDFVKVGVMITSVNAVVYWVFLILGI